MEQRLANAWHMTVNEKKFIEIALLSNLRVDGRHPFDYRQLTINFAREDGSSEVQLGQTHVMGLVTAQLVQPYRDRPNEGSLAIYTEFSPMADSSFEAGRPGESAVELGRIIDRGLRESRAVDTESLCVVAGKLVWSIRIDLHILDNGGNLVDAANIAALAALMTFRRPECTLGGEDGQEVTVHPPEVLEPHPLIIHHLPIAMTFAFIFNDNTAVIDPTHYEEAIMKGRMTVTLNANGDVCAIQKAGGVGIMHGLVLQCLQIAAVKAADITSKIETAVESYKNERALSKINIHASAAALAIDSSYSKWEEKSQSFSGEIETAYQIKKSASQVNGSSKTNDMKNDEPSSRRWPNASDIEAKISVKGPLCWDPYSKGVDSERLRSSIASHGKSMPKEEDRGVNYERRPSEGYSSEQVEIKIPISVGVSNLRLNTKEKKTLKDAVKPKNKRKKMVSSTNMK